jgi:hypothetical protein
LDTCDVTNGKCIHSCDDGNAWYVDTAVVIGVPLC